MLDPVGIKPSPDEPLFTGIVLLFIFDIASIISAFCIFLAKGWL